MSFQIEAQHTHIEEKLDFMSNSEFDDVKVSALIKGDLNKIKAYLSGQGKFKYAHGDTLKHLAELQQDADNNRSRRGPGLNFNPRAR